MRTTQIHGTDLFPSSLCMGSGDMGGTIDQDHSFQILDAFLSLGGSFIDTAKIYNDWIPGEKSRSEKTIGAWMKARKNRDQVILSTKGAHFNLDTPQQPRLSTSEIQMDLDASLDHLQTDRIDMYWLHRDDPRRSVDEIIQTLETQVQAGKIRYYGFSNWRRDRLSQAMKYASENGCQGFSAVQNMWSLAKINPDGISDPTMVTMDDDLWEFHHTHQITAIPYSSQANGLFQKLAGGSIETLSRMHRQMYINPETERRLHQVLVLQKQTGLTITQIVLGYLLSQPFPTIPIFSTRNIQQLEDTMSAADIRLTQDQVEMLLS